MAEEESSDIIIVERKGEFFRLTRCEFHELFGDYELSCVNELKDNYFLMGLFVLTIFSAVLWYFWKASYTLVDSNIAKAFWVLVLNLPLHEAGHILCLKIFYPKSKIKMGMKFTFIYPSFFVDTSYSYLLPRSKKVMVHLAGGFVNSLFLMAILCTAPKQIPYLYLLVSNILINFIPIVKGDGYYALASLRNKFHFKKTAKAAFLEDLVRGVIMFAVLDFLAMFYSGK